MDYLERLGQELHDRLKYYDKIVRLEQVCKELKGYSEIIKTKSPSFRDLTADEKENISKLNKEYDQIIGTFKKN